MRNGEFRMSQQFFNTLRQIIHSDSVGPMRGVGRHLRWQIRKMLRQFPCELPIGESSRMFIDHANGVAALVNAMGPYDFNNMSLLRTLLHRFGGVFIDVGANIGAYTLVASEECSCRVVSIEPHPRSLALLRENVRRNHRSNVICVGVALSDAEGWCSFTDQAELSINRIASPDGISKVLRVCTRTLQTVCDELALIPDFVKIDVEGHEERVLDGFGDLASVPKAMWIEGGERASIRQRMHESGYSGPYYIHYRTHHLSPIPRKRKEDPVYVLRDFIPSLGAIGFEIRPLRQSIKAPREPATART